MKKLFSTHIPDSAAHMVLLLTRVFAGSFMLTHGYPKFLKLTSGNEIDFADPFGLGAYTSFLLTVFAEFVCSILIVIGLATRPAAFLIVVTMMVAAFYAHLHDPFGAKEKALLFGVIFAGLMVLGSGKYSLDALINKRR